MSITESQSPYALHDVPREFESRYIRYRAPQLWENVLARFAGETFGAVVENVWYAL